MSMATIFAYLLATGLCAQAEFQAPDGTRLAVMVCPRTIATEPAPSGNAPPEPPPAEKRT